MIDENSPGFPEYMKECEALTAELGRKERELDARQKKRRLQHGQGDTEEVRF